MSKAHGKHSGSYSDIIIAVEMLQRLEEQASRALPINGLAEEFDRDPKTIKRYIDALQEVDGPDGKALVERIYPEGPGGRAWVQLNLPERNLSNTIFEYAAVYAATRHFEAVKDPVLGILAGNVLDDIAADEQYDGMDLMGRVRRAFHYVSFGPKDYSRDPKDDTLDAGVRAVLQQRSMKIRYRPGSGRAYWQRIEPYTLVLYRDGLYLLARVKRKSSTPLRLFAIDRVLECSLGDIGSVEIPEGYDPADWFKNQLGIWRDGSKVETLRVAFHPDVLRGAKERNWPGFKSWTTLEDGRGVLELRVPITPEVTTWVLTWGDAAEVLSPRHFRRDLQRSLKAALKQYETC